MNQEIEIEFKNLLTLEEYDLLYSKFFNGPSSSYTQKNVYYDTDKYNLKQLNCAMRIRIKESAAEFTLKSPHEGHHKELNIPLTKDEAEQLILSESIPVPVQIRVFLNHEYELDITRLSKIADLTTQRVERDYEGCLFVLDKSWYSGVTDYELEIEAPSIEEGKLLFDTILAQHSIPVRHTLNKIARSQKALEND